MALFGLIGWPIEHSLSPVLHNAGFKAEGLDNDYALVPIHPDAFATEIETVLSQYRGLNVTTPYKQKVLPYLDELSETAQKINAVNTIYRLPDGRLYGDSTDGQGFWTASDIQSGDNVVMIGVGGAARAIMATTPADVNLSIINRRSERFEQYAEIVDALLGNQLLDLATFDDWEYVDVVIDATSLGLNEHETILSETQLSQLPKTSRVIDLKYGQDLTPLLEKGQAQGLNFQDGKGMLLEQAILSHAAWINGQPDRKSMTQALLDSI